MNGRITGFFKPHASLLICLAVVLAAGVSHAGEVGYQIARTVVLGAPDRWDYVYFDAGSHRVYAAHGDRVTVVDGRDGTIVGQVEGFPGGTHGIAIVAALGKGYSDDGRAGTASSFDLETLKLRRTVQADEDADAIVYDPASDHVFVVDGDPGRITVIDPKTDAVLATVQVGLKLEFAVAGGNGKLFVNAARVHQIVRIDTSTNEIDAYWPMDRCEGATGLAIDPAAHRLFSSCRNGMLVVVDANTGQVVTNLAIGRGTDAAAFDPKRKLIFSSNGQDGTLSVIQEKDAQTYQPLATVKTTVGAKTMSIDPGSGRLYLLAADVATSSNGASQTATLQSRPTWVPGSLKMLFLDPTF